MALQAALCNQCGGALKVEDTDLNGYCECPFCHASSKIIEVITIDGLPTVKAHLQNASIAFQNGDVDGAMNLYNEAIKIKPNCYEAWWGLYKLQCMVDQYYGYMDKYGNGGLNIKAAIIQQTLQKYAYRAIQYAPKHIAENYKRDILPSEQFIQGVRTGQIQEKKGFFQKLFK